MKKQNGRSTKTELPKPVRIKLDLSETVTAEQLIKIKGADHLIVNDAEFLSKDRTVKLMEAWAEDKGFADLKSKHEALKTSFNKVYEDHKKLLNETAEYKRLNRTFLQKVKEKIKK